jgi:Holliday junction resolvasome RuvABC endonuclease subunit
VVTPSPPGGVVLGIDASYAGLAIVSLTRDDVAWSVCGSWTKSKGPVRLAEIEDWLISVLGAWPMIEHVVMENYSPGSKFGREKAGELGGLVKKTLYQRIPGEAGFPTLMAPSSLKLFVTGSGKSDKDQITKEVLRKWGFDAPNNDVADAYGLAKVAQAIQWGSSDCLAYEQVVLGKLTRHTEHPDHDTADRARSRGSS